MTSSTINNRIYDIKNEFLICIDKQTGKEVFRKSYYDNVDIFQLCLTQKNNLLLRFNGHQLYDKVVHKSEIHTIALVNQQGEILWWAEHPAPNQAKWYSSINIIDNQIFALASDWRYILDENTGKIISREFVK